MKSSNVLIVGSGGREHALAWKISQSNLVRRVYVAPGNGGTKEWNVEASSFDALSKFANQEDCFTIVGPETPLSLGIVDFFEQRNLPIFGPTRKQAQIETSKSFAKKLMKEKAIPSAEFGLFSDPEEAMSYAKERDGQVVVKADGLASGKGVFVCSSYFEAENAIKSILVGRIFGDSGNQLLIEEKLYGREVSFFAFCDGKNGVPFGTAVDHKRLLDKDLGPNTGGMGSYSPALNWSEKDTNEIMERIVRPIVSDLGFKGFLFVGLILTEKGPKVLEFNCRLGDPETQSILPRLQSDLFSLMLQSRDGSLADCELSWSLMYSCCVVMCSEGYPSSNLKTGKKIIGLEKTSRLNNLLVFHSGTSLTGNQLVTSGGRVLGVTGLASTLEEARSRAYEGVKLIEWEGEHHRNDIGLATISKLV